MNTKSALQIITEQITMKAGFIEDVSRLMEQYDVKDNIFAVGSQDGTAIEPTKGYWYMEGEYDDLQEAVSHMNVATQALRIRQGKYIVGTITEGLPDIDAGEIVDLERGVSFSVGKC